MKLLLVIPHTSLSTNIVACSTCMLAAVVNYVICFVFVLGSIFYVYVCYLCDALSASELVGYPVDRGK